MLCVSQVQNGVRRAKNKLYRYFISCTHLSDSGETRGCSSGFLWLVEPFRNALMNKTKIIRTVAYCTTKQVHYYLFSVIIRVRVVFRKAVVGDWSFDYLNSSHLQSQVKSRHQIMVFMPLVVVWIGQFCCDVIGSQNVKVAVIGWLLFCYYFLSVYCLLSSVSFIWGHVLYMYESFVRCR